MHAKTEPIARTVHALADRHWRIALATATSLAISWPLILHGTPDSEIYSFSVFSTVAFAQNLAAGVDPWFVPTYGFGIPLPSGGWMLKFPPAVPAALLGVDVLYATVWLVGAFMFSFYFLKLCGELTNQKVVAAILLLTALLSFSNLGPSYVDDWPDQFLGWSLFPMCVWFILRTLRSESSRQRIRAAAACSVVLGVLAGATHLNTIATLFSGLALFLACMLWTRPKGVLAVGVSMVIALISAADVLAPRRSGITRRRAQPDRRTHRSAGRCQLAHAVGVRCLSRAGPECFRRRTGRGAGIPLSTRAILRFGPACSWRRLAPCSPSDPGPKYTCCRTTSPGALPWVLVSSPR